MASDNLQVLNVSFRIFSTDYTDELRPLRKGSREWGVARTKYPRQKTKNSKNLSEPRNTQTWVKNYAKTSFSLVPIKASSLSNNFAKKLFKSET